MPIQFVLLVNFYQSIFALVFVPKILDRDTVILFSLMVLVFILKNILCPSAVKR
jgi:hypothetical protein